MQPATNLKSTFNAVYFVTTKSRPINLIAIRPTLNGAYIQWEDTSRGKSVKFSKLTFDGKELAKFKDESIPLPQKIEIVSDKGEVYQLVKLTNILFTEKVKKTIALGEEMKFSSDEDVQKYYLDTDF